MPLYLVAAGEGDQKKERLVEANNSAVARNHVARESILVEVASSRDLFRLAKAGIEIEVANGAAQVQEELPPPPEPPKPEPEQLEQPKKK